MEDDSNTLLPVKNSYRRAVDLQRMKLEKLMKNPEKPAYIPEPPRNKKFPDAPEFVRNVMGSSAGAGSGEFHVYRHIRRREYARELTMQKCKEIVELDDEYERKIQENKIKEEEKTAKKRRKRQRRKEKLKSRKKTKSETHKEPGSSSSADEEEENTIEDPQQGTFS